MLSCQRILDIMYKEKEAKPLFVSCPRMALQFIRKLETLKFNYQKNLWTYHRSGGWRTIVEVPFYYYKPKYIQTGKILPGKMQKLPEELKMLQARNYERQEIR